MDETCMACLISGRNLLFIKDTGCYSLYYQILSEIEVVKDRMEKLDCIRICWECRAIMCRFQRFKSRAQQSYRQMMGPQAAKLSNKHTLTTNQVINISFPELNVKSEPNDYLVVDNLVTDEIDYDLVTDVIVNSVKSETVDSEVDTHCEPETFVRDLNLDPEVEKKAVKRTNTKQVKKKVKKKKPAKVKVKENVSDLEHLLEDGNENTEVKEEVNKLQEKKIDCDTEVDVKNSKTVTKKAAPSAVGERPQCVECGKIFSSKKTYRYHLNVLHKGQNRYPCPRCGKVYQWKSNLGRHLRSHKARDSGELRCSPCGKLFASVATYRQHMRISRRHVPEAEFSFTCDECGKKFVNKTRLRDHIDWEHLKKIKFRCQICNKPFKCHTSLYVHLQNVHRERHSRDNLCHVCGKSYQNGAKLKYHIVAMHSGETPYQCERCSAAFGWYSSLYRHVREVHHKMKVQPKKSKRLKKLADGLTLLPLESPSEGAA